jgi:hypothetical protein
MSGPYEIRAGELPDIEIFELFRGSLKLIVRLIKDGAGSVTGYLLSFPKASSLFSSKSISENCYWP